jgi:hypothetical protein
LTADIKSTYFAAEDLPMARISTDKEREIIEDFAAEIQRKRTQTAKPTKAVIDFRNERADNFVRDIWEVPTEILRFRKDNGRIASDVLSYEKNYRPLNETEDEDQEALRKFLQQKDPAKTEVLKNSLLHSGQSEPAIITCDGFLINGNRRKLALEALNGEHPGKFQTMKVVILPGKDDQGGPPTNKEIEQIENRYQLQSDGKAEYYNFDRALSMRRKIQLGISLEDQLKDDPNYASLPSKEFKKAVKEVDDDYLGPLTCVDEYLEHLGREGLYDTVSSGRDDREGRWQAFIDYYISVNKKLNDKKKLIEMGIAEDEVGKIKDAAFKIIRKREIPNSRMKVHMIMRKLPNWLTNPEAKKALLKLVDVEMDIPADERVNQAGEEIPPRTIDKLWGERYGSQINNCVLKAERIIESTRTAETPITLLEAALAKLNHEKMDIRVMHATDIERAKTLIKGIRDKTQSLETEFYHLEKELKKEKKLPKRA